MNITPEDIRSFREAEAPLTQVARRAASRSPIDDICCNTPTAMGQKFSIDLPTLPACDQKSSGRCWIFAALNFLREKAAKDLNVEELELSQSYFSFYDHLEKANGFYTRIIETANDPLDDRYVSLLLSEPVGDGGWWEYFSGLCQKYGAVPIDAMPDTYQATHSGSMNMILNMQLRKDALVLRNEIAAGNDPAPLVKSMLSRVYRVLSVCLGNPPETFDFEYVDKDKHYHAHRNLTPSTFCDRFIGRSLPDMVSIMNAPIPQAPFYGVYYTRGEESICGAHQEKRLNLPLEEFKAAVIRQLEAGDPVWFVCDCDYYGDRKAGIWDTDLFDYESFFGLDLAMTKGDLLNYRQCSLNHAMALTGVNLVDGAPDKWKIQNSWGEDNGEKGYFVMSDRWFDRYVFTAAIDRKFLTPAQQEAFTGDPVCMAPWNVLG